MSEEPLFDPRDFIIADGIAHLCAGGESACLHRHATAVSRYLRDKSNGMADRVAQEGEIARARAGIARSWGVDAASIGFVGNVAEGVSIVAESLDWRDDSVHLRCSGVRSTFPLKRDRHDTDAFFELVNVGFLRSEFDFHAEYRHVRALMRRYRKQPMAFADACLVRMAELRPDALISTLDRDFHVYRKHGRPTLSLVTPW